MARLYHSKPNGNLDDRVLSVATGACLGGGSAINCMAYVRAQMCDLDDWDLQGWGSKDMVPLLKRVFYCRLNLGLVC